MGAPAEEPEDDKPAKTLDADDIRFLKTYGLGPYSTSIKGIETDLKEIQKRVIETIGIKESDTGLAPPSRWDLVSDKQMLYEEQPLQVRASAALQLGRQLVHGTCTSPACHSRSCGTQAFLLIWHSRSGRRERSLGPTGAVVGHTNSRRHACAIFPMRHIINVASYGCIMCCVIGTALGNAAPQDVHQEYPGSCDMTGRHHQ
jgi:hypothetical protein